MNYQENKEQVFLGLIEKHKGILFKICRHYAEGSQLNYDLMQEILAVSWKAFDRFEGKSQFSTWLYRVGLNTAITYQRKEKRKPYHESIDAIYHLPYEDNEINIEEEVKLLYKAIKQLSKVDKAIILLYLEKKTYEEIGEIIGTTKNNIGVRVNRIKTKLKNILEEFSYERY